MFYSQARHKLSSSTHPSSTPQRPTKQKLFKKPSPIIRPEPFPTIARLYLNSMSRSSSKLASELGNAEDLNITPQSTVSTKKPTSWLSKPTTTSSTAPVKRKQLVARGSSSSSDSSSTSSDSSSSSTSSSSSSSSSSSDSDSEIEARKTKNNKRQKVISTTKTAASKSTTKAKVTKPKQDDVQDIEDLRSVQTTSALQFDQLQDKHIRMIAQYLLIRKMRGNGPAMNAPVDTMGCAVTGDRTQTPERFRFETLVSLMLSAQTKDAVTFAAVAALRSRLPGGLTPQTVLDNQELAHECIKSVGFHNIKIKNMVKTAEILINEYDSDIPHTTAGLLKLPGIGPKMAILTMQAVFPDQQGIGIGVDTHVQRISTSILHWVPDFKSPTPEKTRATLEKIIPPQYWDEVNFLLVGFGQTICPARAQKCMDCWLSKTKLCTSSAPQATKVHNDKIKAKAEELIKNGQDAFVRDFLQLDGSTEQSTSNSNPAVSGGLVQVSFTPTTNPGANGEYINFANLTPEQQRVIYTYTVNLIMGTEFGVSQAMIRNFLTDQPPKRDLQVNVPNH